MTHPVTHISASSISDWVTCPLRWHGRRVAKWPEPASPAMAMGSAMHAAFEAHHLGKDAEAALMAAWTDMGVAEMSPPPGALGRAFEALRAYRAFNPRDRRDRPEKKFSIRIHGLPVPIIGYLDLIRGPEIQEMKTGNGKWWTQAKVDAELQPAVYWLAYIAMLKMPPERVVYQIVPTQPYVKPAFSLATLRTEQRLSEFKTLARRVWGEIQRGELRAACPPGRCLFPAQCAPWRNDDGPTTEPVLTAAANDSAAIHLQP